MKRLPLLLFLFFSFLSCSSREQIMEVEDGDAVLTLNRLERPWNPGVQEELEFRLRGARNLELRFPPATTEEMEISLWESRSYGGVLKVSLLKGGEYTFPELKFTADGDHFFTLQEWKFSVNTLVQGEGEMKPNQAPLSLGLLRSWQWILLSFFLMVVALLLFFIWYKRQEKKREESRLSFQLRNELEKYRKSDPVNRQNGRDFYLEITGLLRLFLDQVYSLGTSGSTREEFLPILLGLKLFPSREHPWLIRFWEKADRIKFADFQNDLPEREEDLKKTLKILEKILENQKEKELHDSL